MVGASLESDRYSNKAIHSLRNKSIVTFGFGLMAGEIGDVTVSTVFPTEKRIHTVTMYVRASRQSQYYEDIVRLDPKRVIFNPGAENTGFVKILEEKGIEPVEACTLVMLSVGNY